MDISETDSWKDGIKPKEKIKKPLRKKPSLAKIIPQKSNRYVQDALRQTKKDPALRPLTPKQDLFCRIYATKSFQGVSAQDCALEAGFGKGKNIKTARVMASNMLNPRRSPHIVAAIRRYTEELTRQYATDTTRSLAALHRIREIAIDEKQLASAVAAEKARASIAGINSPIHVKHTHSIDSMSIDQVRKELEKIKSSEIIDVEATTENSTTLDEGIELLESDI